jgi:hypothetical protein
MKTGLESDTPRDTLKTTVKPLIETAKTAIRSAHEALKKAAQALPHTADEPKAQDSNS